MTKERTLFEELKKKQLSAHRDNDKLKRMIMELAPGAMFFTIEITPTRIDYSYANGLKVIVSKTKKPIVGYPTPSINIESCDEYILEYYHKIKKEYENAIISADEVKKIFFGPRNQK